MTAPDFKGLRLPLPRAVQGQVQLGFASAMVLGHMSLATIVLVSLGRAFPKVQDPVLKSWMRGVLLWAGVDLSVEGLENLDPAGHYVFVSNHQSHLDVPCVSTALPMPLRFVAKRSLLKIPVFGAGMRAVGTVDIDRNDKSDTVRKLVEAQRSVGLRYCIHFFAEGTRSVDGRLRAFKKGAAAMALSLQVPLVPIAVTGTRRIFRKGSFKLHPDEAHVTIGKPIPPGPSDTPEERTRLTELAREQVRQMLLARGEPADEQDGDPPRLEDPQEVAVGR